MLGQLQQYFLQNRQLYLPGIGLLRIPTDRFSVRGHASRKIDRGEKDQRKKDIQFLGAFHDF